MDIERQGWIVVNGWVDWGKRGDKAHIKPMFFQVSHICGVYPDQEIPEVSRLLFVNCEVAVAEPLDGIRAKMELALSEEY